MEICSWRCRTSGVPRDASRWHRRGARRRCAADSVHCRPYANPRVECPRWVGLTEGAAPSACDQNDCRKGSHSTTLLHRTAPTSSCTRVRSNDSYCYATNRNFGSVGTASTTLRPSANTPESNTQRTTRRCSYVLGGRTAFAVIATDVHSCCAGFLPPACVDGADRGASCQARSHPPQQSTSQRPRVVELACNVVRRDPLPATRWPPSAPSSVSEPDAHGARRQYPAGPMRPTTHISYQLRLRFL
jgi:hypothetical protein